MTDRALREAVEALLPYAQHRAECATRDYGWFACDCDLPAVKLAAQNALDEPAPETRKAS